MKKFDKGTTVVAELEVRNESGDLVNASGTVYISYIPPGGAEVIKSTADDVTNPSTGVYRLEIDADTPSERPQVHWQVRGYTSTAGAMFSQTLKFEMKPWPLG